MAVRAMELQVKIPGAEAGAKAIKSLAAAYREVADVTKGLRFPAPAQSTISRVDALTAKLEKLAKAYESVGAAGAGAGFPGPGGGGRGGAGGGGGRRGSGPGYLTGPNQRLEQIAQQRMRAEGEGNATVLRDLDILEFRAKRSKILGERRLSQGDAALKGPGLLDLFQDLNSLMGSLKSGNIGGIVRGITLLQGVHGGAPGGLNAQQVAAGMGRVPIAGIGQAGGAWWQQAAGAAGGIQTPGWVAGAARIAGPLAAAAAGAVLLAKATKAAAVGLNRTFGAATISGGTPGSIAALAGMGIAPEAVPGAAAGLRGRLSSDPFAMIAGARIGLGPRIDPRLGGDQDLTKDLVKALKGLRGLRGDLNDQLLQARRLGLEGFLPQVNVSPRIQRLQDLAEQSAQRDPRALQMARDFTESKRLADESWRNLWQAVGEVGMPPGEWWNRAIAGMNNAVAQDLRQGPNRMSFRGMSSSMPGIRKVVGDPAARPGAKGRGLSPGEQAAADIAFMQDFGGARASSAVSQEIIRSSFLHADHLAEMEKKRTGRMMTADWRYRQTEAELLQFGSIGAFGI